MRRTRTKRDWQPKPQSEPGLCDHPQCGESGEFRAPKSRWSNDGYYHFCLGHVREYNESWDYFSGMSQTEIERHQHDIATWDRPTWRIGVKLKPGSTFGYDMRDDMEILRDGGFAHDKEPPEVPLREVDREERQALEALDLSTDVGLDQIKAKYKQLVKKFHPDANGGDKSAEERLKSINQAYTYLLSCGYS